MERKISAKINYDVLKDLDKSVTPVESTGPTVEDVTRQAIAGITEKLNTDLAHRGGVDGQFDTSDSSDSSSTLKTSRSTLPTLGRGRLPSLHSRKRSLPSFASESTSTVATK